MLIFNAANLINLILIVVINLIINQFQMNSLVYFMRLRESVN